MIQYPSIPISGSAVSTSISGFPDTQSLVIYNESPYFLQVQLVGSGTYGLAAYTADAFQVFNGFTGGINFTPTPYIAVQSGSPPASIVFIQAYGSQEPLTRLFQTNSATGYPISLNRLQNIGNGAEVAGTANSIVNDGNSSGTSIVESTVSGDTGSAVSISNDAQVTLGTVANPAKIALTGVIESATSILTIENASGSSMLQISDNGGGIQLGRTSTGDAIDQTSSAMYFKSVGGGFNFQHPNGTTLASFQAFNYGHVNGTSATVTHGLGGTPSGVLIVPNIAQPGSATCGVGNIGSTTFQATVGAGTGFYWFAIR